MKSSPCWSSAPRPLRAIWPAKPMLVMTSCTIWPRTAPPRRAAPWRPIRPRRRAPTAISPTMPTTTCASSSRARSPVSCPTWARRERALRALTIETLERLARDQLPRVRAVLAESIKSLDCIPKYIVLTLARDVETMVAAPDPGIFAAAVRHRPDRDHRHRQGRTRSSRRSRGASRSMPMSPMPSSPRSTFRPLPRCWPIPTPPSARRRWTASSPRPRRSRPGTCR